MFHIGKFLIQYPVIPAPMCGVMDAPFREMILSFGAPMIYSEMLASHATILNNRQNYINKTIFNNTNNNQNKNPIPFVTQIAGCDPQIMANAAKICEQNGADIIDMNFGCPVKKVTNGFAGSALMKDEILSAKIIESVVNAVKIPVTIKMRMGWDFENLNAPKLAKIGENSGIKTVTIHCRTRNQLYTGNADWNFAKKIKENVKIPVIINGDIKDIETMNEALKLSNADGVMVGRGLYGKPWLIAELMHYMKTKEKISLKPNNQEMYKLIIKHIELIQKFYDNAALGFIIKHLFFYSKGIEGGSEFRNNISKENNIDKIIEHLKKLYIF